LKKVDHIGVAVNSLDEALPYYTETLGLPLLGIEEVESDVWMRNETFRKVIIYLMIITMLLSTFVFGLSFLL